MKAYNSIRIICQLHLLLFACMATFFILGCEEYEYPEEPTSEGLNTHGFKINGIKWVRRNIPYGLYVGISLMTESNRIEALLPSKIEGAEQPEGVLKWIIYKIENIIDLPKEYFFSDSLNIYTQIDSSMCYTYFLYQDTGQIGFTEYGNVISGSVIITRYDNICSGTFNLDIASDTDTLYITDGKFDYVIKTY